MKLLTILLCIFLLVGTVSACDFTPNTPTPSGGAIQPLGDHHYTKGILTIPINPATLIKAWQYEDIEIV